MDAKTEVREGRERRIANGQGGIVSVMQTSIGICEVYALGSL